MSLCQCALNGVDPTQLSPEVTLTDVREHPPVTVHRVMNPAGREGSRVTAARRTSLSVSLDFELHEPSPARRKHLCRELARWAAGGGWLTVSDRPGQRLRVTCDAPPVIASSQGWTEPVTVTLTAWDMPSWEATLPVSARTSEAATTSTLTLRVPGDRPALLEAAVTNASGQPVTAVTLSCGGQTLRLTGLDLNSGETLLLTHDERALTRLVIRRPDGVERSVLHRRDPSSADELWLEPRTSCAVTCTADGAITALLTARGRWL